MKFNNIIVHLNGGIATLTINRPKKLNALNRETIFELHEALNLLNQDESVRVIILTGSEDKAFVAGADISEFVNFSHSEAAELSRKGQELLFHFAENLGTPIIAAINGFALGGGLELAMSAHIRIASRSARMGLPEVSLGLIPGYGGTQRLAQLIGRGRALQMIISAEMIEASTAEQWGLVNVVTPPEKLMQYCITLAKKIKNNSPLAIKSAIAAVNANYKQGVNGYNAEILEFAKSFMTSDFKEGTSAFLEKRKANFTGH